MVKIIWTPQSLSDLDSIAEYIATDSIYYADLVVENIINSIESIRLFPKIGRIVPEYHHPNIREIFYRRYRIIYEIKNNTIDILTIFHSSRLLENK